MKTMASKFTKVSLVTPPHKTWRKKVDTITMVVMLKKQTSLFFLRYLLNNSQKTQMNFKAKKWQLLHKKIREDNTIHKTQAFS